MNLLGEFLIGAVYVAIIFTLVRPQSPAAAAIQATSSALVGVVGSVTGYNQTSTGS